MTVSISGYLEFEEEGTYLVLLISDTGEGFDEATLRRLNAKEPIIKDGRRSIGIANVRSRLQIIYGSQASIKFFNNQPKGAVVQIRFPEKQIPGDKIC